MENIKNPEETHFHTFSYKTNGCTKLHLVIRQEPSQECRKAAKEEMRKRKAAEKEEVGGESSLHQEEKTKKKDKQDEEENNVIKEGDINDKTQKVIIEESNLVLIPA